MDIKVLGGATPKFLEEKERARNASRNPSRCRKYRNHCCESACCCNGFFTCVLLPGYCPCGSLRAECRPQRLCGGPDPDPDTEAFQPCRDRRCFHCFGPDQYDDDSEEDFSDEDFSDYSVSEDSGFEEMD